MTASAALPTAKLKNRFSSVGDCLRNSGPENECRLSAKAKVGLREFVGFLGVSAKGRYVSDPVAQLKTRGPLFRHILVVILMTFHRIRTMIRQPHPQQCDYDSIAG